MDKGEKNKGDSKFNDMLEWQDKQYTPWHYFQKGKTIPGIAGEGNLKTRAIITTIVGIIAIIGFILIAIAGFVFNDLRASIIFMGFAGISIWEIIFHWKRYKKQKACIKMNLEKRKQQRKKRKRH